MCCMYLSVTVSSLSLFVFCPWISVPRLLLACPGSLRSVPVCVCHWGRSSESLSPGSVGLFMSLSLWVCLYLSLFVTMSVPLCVTIYPVSPCVLLTAQATGGRVGPAGARAGAQPGPPSPAHRRGYVPPRGKARPQNKQDWTTPPRLTGFAAPHGCGVSLRTGTRLTVPSL